MNALAVRPGRALPLVLMLAASIAAGGAKKRLTFDQVFRNASPRLTEPLPAVTGWADDDHFIQQRRREGGPGGPPGGAEEIVDVHSGKSAPWRDLEKFRAGFPEGIDPARPVAVDARGREYLYEKEGLLYLLDTVRGGIAQITHERAERKNPEFSPGGDYLAYTQDHDLYSVRIADGRVARLTHDGSDVVYSGWASWLYYEEILGRPSRYRAFWWSPDGSRIAFFRFDDARVPAYPLFSSAGVTGRTEETRYPRAGDPNPRVRVGIAPAAGGTTVWAAFDTGADCYYGTPCWTPDGGALWVQWMNRAQDTLRIVAVDPRSGGLRTVYEETQPSWVEWLRVPLFVRGGFLIRTDRDGWMHIERHDMAGRLAARLTQGAWSVTEMLAVDESAGSVFFTARKEATTRTDLYRVGLDGRGLRRLTFGPWTHTVSVSPHGKYFVTTYSDVRTPPRMSLLDGEGSVVRALGDAKSDAFDDYDIGRTELFAIRTPDGYELPAVLTLPPGFDSTARYPVLISVYGGPNSSSVADGWRGIEPAWLAGEGLIQMSVDHRGSGHFGKAGVALMKGKLGTWEMNDYCEAVRWLRRLPFIDSTRVCITGGSYGGYVTCLALTRGADFFTHGNALYSVTDWRLYDSHYVERYMGTPAENPAGYAGASVLTYAPRYHGMLRIVHGTMDDNVHMQNSLQLVDTLEVLGRHFEFMAYPLERHGWGGAKAVHLRNESYRFYYTYLLRKEFPERLFENAPLGGRRRM